MKTINLKKDLLLAKQLYWYTNFLTIAIAFGYSYINLEYQLRVVLAVYTILLSLTYVVSWRGLRALGTLYSSPDINLAAIGSTCAAVFPFLVFLFMYLFEEKSSTIFMVLSLEQALPNLIMSLMPAPIFIITGKGFSSLPSENFGTLPNALQRYYLILALGCILAAIGNYLGSPFYLVEMFGNILFVAWIPILTYTYKIYKIAILECQKQETEMAASLLQHHVS
jgi:hypothetical protein